MLKKKLKAGITNLRSFIPPKLSPDEVLGELFQDVQLRQIHADGKTFVDSVSERKLRQIAQAYREARLTPGFDLHEFVQQHFRQYLVKTNAAYQAMEDRTAREHIEALWPVLTRQNYRNRGSLMALPYPYIVPGGRFLEQYYWDSYFAMLGLAATGHSDVMEDMVKNFAFMIRKVGFIPSANRTYYLTRSHPPFFARMVRLLAEKRGKRIYLQYLPYLLAEYRFWMRGRKDLSDKRTAVRRVVRMPDGSVLNRYFDNKQTPRPESYREDVETASHARERVPGQVYLDLRAGAESGWDFSSRWFKDPGDISSIHTTDLIPVDLNCLLYDLEKTIARAYGVLKQSVLAKRFETRARQRAQAIRTYCWSTEAGFFFDYDFIADQRTSSYSMAAAFPLYSKLATQQEAARVAAKLESDFLRPGGFVTTLTNTTQQWDAPNGWAPLQWVGYKALKNYGFNELAQEAKRRWMTTNITMYDASGKFVEKYNVVDVGDHAGGGEYDLQDGFGWTNGIFLAMDAERD